MREILLIVAASAGAWAVAVFGIATNRPFGVFLFVVALALIIASYNEQGIKACLRHWRGRTVVAVGGLVVVGLGWFLATSYNEVPRTGNDSEARAAITDLRTEVARLQGQVEAATDFQQREKEEREAREKRAVEERRLEQVVVAQARRQREALCAQMDELRKEAIALRVRLVQADASPPLRREVNTFLDRACSELPESECRAFRAAAGPGGGPVGYPVDDGGFWSAVTGKINFFARRLETSCQ